MHKQHETMKLHDLKTDKINDYGDSQSEILLAKGGGRWIVADIEEHLITNQNIEEMKHEPKKEMPKKATKPAAPKMPKSPKSPKVNPIKPK